MNEYLPGGRWVRVISLAGHRVHPVGNWHRATAASVGRPDRDPFRIEVDCTRELHAGLVAEGELLFTAEIPLANVCRECRRSWHAERARERHPHLYAVPAQGAAAPRGRRAGLPELA